VRAGFTNLVVQSLARLRPVEESKYFDEEQYQVTVPDRSEGAAAGATVRVKRTRLVTETSLFMQYWLSEEVCNIMIPAWRFFDQFHEVIEKFAYFGHSSRRLLDRMEAAPILLDWFMGKKSPIGDSGRFAKSRSRTAAQGSKTYTPKFGPLLRAVSIMVRASRLRSQRVFAASFPPTLVTYGHDKPNQLDVAAQLRSQERGRIIADHNRKLREAGREQYQNAFKFDDEHESRDNPDYIRPLSEMQEETAICVLGVEFWLKVFTLYAGRDSMPLMAAHLAWNDADFALDTIVPATLGKHQYLDYDKVGVVEEVMYEIARCPDVYQGARIELLLDGKGEQFRERMLIACADADPILHVLRNDEIKYPDAARESAIFAARLARLHKAGRAVLLKNDCYHLERVERILR